MTKSLFNRRPGKAEEQTNLGEKVVEPEEEDANETDKEQKVDDNSGQDGGSQVIDPQQVYKERRNMVIKLAFKCVELYIGIHKMTNNFDHVGHIT